MSIPSNLSEREDVAAMTLRAFKEQVSKTICDIVVCEMKEKAANLTVEDLAGLKDVLFEKLQAEAPLLYKYVWQENSIALESLRTLGEGCSYAVVAGDVSLLSHTLILVIMKCVAPGKACHGLIFGTLISKVVRCMLNKHTQKLNVEAPTSEELDGVSDMLTAIWQVIAIARGGINSNPKDIRSLAASVFDGIGSVGNKTRSLMLFFSNICACVYKIYVMISDKVFGVKVGASILYRDKAVLQLWAKEVGILTSPENEYNIMNNPKWFARLATASHVGDYFAVEMTKAGCKDIPATFAPLKKRINDEYQRALNLGVATAFRPEAVGLYCFGPPGLGKTRDKDEIVQALLETMGIEQTGNDVFVLSEGMKHWTGCDGKKVLYMDDFLVVETQTTGETIGLLMHAISDARLTPPQAAIEDKGRAFAPALVYINSNHRMPTPVCLHEHEAFYRRRHICWEVDRSQEFKAAGFRNLESTGAIDWVKANSTPDNSRPHAIYRFYDTLTGSSSSGWMRFESFLEMMRERVLKKYLDNVIQYEKKLSNCKVACSKDVDSPLTMHLQRIHLAVDELAGSSNREVRKIWEVPLQHAEEAATYVRDWVTQFFGSKMDVEAAKCIHSPLYYLPIRMEDGKAYWEAGPFRRQEVEIKFCEPECDLKKAYYVERMCTFYRERGCPDKAEWFMSKTLGPAKPVPTLSGSAEEFVESVQREANLTRPVWPTNARYAAIGLACLAGAFGTWHVMKYMFGGRLTSDDSEVVSYKHVTPEIAKPSPESVITTPVVRKETEVISSGDIKTSNKQSHHGIARKTTEALETESYSDFVRLIDRNMCYLVLNGIDRASGMEIKNFTMRIFGICGTWIVVQSHYIAKINRTINRTVKFVNYCATVSRPISLEKCETKNFVDSELSLLRLPVDIPQFRDIRPHIMTEQDSERISTRANIFEKELGREGITYPVVIKIMKGVEYYDGDVPFKIPTAFTYKWQAPGRCMSPLIGNLGAGNKLIGFHFCGGQGDGCAEPIVKESFEFMRNVLQVQAPNTEWLDANKSTPITLSGDLIPLGVVSSKYAVRPAERSTIVPSLIQGYVPPVTRPAPLTPNDVGGLFSPLVTGCNKHGLPPTGFRPDLITRAQKHLQEQYDLLCKPVRTTVGVLSRTEAILGIPSLNGYKGMEMSTSEGFPFTTNRPSTASNKRWLFNMETDAGEVKLISIDPMLEHVLDAKDRLRERGVIPCTVFTDCLKDARISNEAFRKPGKTRIFSISPADFTIQFRQYFLDILAAQQTHRFNMQHMVGMNVHSLEWTALARRLQTKGPSIMCGDYSNFGPGLDSEIVQRVGEVWTNWYTKYETEMGVVEEEREKRARIRKIMFEEMRHSVHLCKDILYRVCCGSPSGAPPTVNINNDVNKMYIYIAWLALSEGQNPIYNNFVSFKEHIEFFVYGDDIILNVSDEVKVWFNNETLSNFFAKHGIRYTDDTKGDTIKKYGTLSEATFLKGSFIQHRSRPMCFNYGLATKSIEDCANWCHYSPDLADATQQAIFDSLMLAYGQGEEYFNAHRQRLLNAWADVQQEPLTLYTYMDMDEMRYGYSLDYETLPIEQLVEKEREWREAFKRAKELARDITPLMVEGGNPYSPTYQKLDKASVERLIRLTKRINKAGGKVEKHISDLYTLLKYGSE